MNVAKQTLLAPIVTTTLYLFVFGINLGQRVSVLEGFSYAQFVIPGLILMGVVGNSFANSSSSLFMSKFIGNIVDLLVLPMGPAHMILAYTLAAMLRGLIVGSIVFAISLFFAAVPVPHPAQAILVILLCSFLFAQFGIIAAILSGSFDDLTSYNNFLITPLIYLGGVFYPISLLPEFWGTVSKINPLYYMIDAFRYCLLGVGENAFWLNISVITAIAAVFFGIASWFIYSGYKIRN